jgi:hypothetical protein
MTAAEAGDGGNLSFPAAPLTEEEALAAAEKLRVLLAAAAGRYTFGESTSLSSAAAGELAASLSCALDLTAPAGVRRFLAADGETAWRRGVARLRMEAARGRELWRCACLHLPPRPSLALEGTLRSMGRYWKTYDAWYGGHRVPEDMDYQLLRPVPEERMGPYYVNEYLRRLLAELALLQALDAAAAERLTAAGDPLWRESVGSLCAFPLARTAALGLLGRDPRSPEWTEEDRRALADLLAGQSPSETARALETALAAACGKLGIRGSAAAYLERCAADLAPCLRAAGAEGLRDLLPTLD